MDEVSEHIKQAREHALVGHYDDSETYYAGALRGVHQILRIQEPEGKRKWRESIGLLSKELDLVKSLSSTLTFFQGGTSDMQYSHVSKEPGVWLLPTAMDNKRFSEFVQVSTMYNW
jgi:hypothetical protein